MRRSQTLRIGGLKIKVLLVPPAKLRSWGAAETPTNTIWIRSDLSRERRVEIFFHEFFHLVMAGRSEEIEKGEGEEVVCDTAAYWLTALLAQNPAFVKQMMYDLSQ